MDSFMYATESQEDDLCNTINTQDLLQFSSSQSLGLSESEEYFNTMPPLSGEELIKMESSYNLNAVLPVLPAANVACASSFSPHPDPEHWHKYPTMEIVESRYALDMHVHPCENQNWSFNPKQNKVFIKLNTVMRLSFTYIPVDVSEKLFLRGMILFASPDDMHFAVKRCANHRVQNDYEGVPNEHILKCCHPKTQYLGKEIGQEFKDRLSFLVELGRPVVDDNGKANESILLEFLCLNSCATGINRKSTAVVFTLENERREIVGKKVLPFKVCSCPRRDMEREELLTSRKRNAPESNESVPVAKLPNMMPDVKEEPTTPSPETSHNVQQFGNTPQAIAPIQTHRTFTLTMPDVDSTKHVLRCAFNEIIGVMANPQINAEVKVNCEEYCQIVKDLLDETCGPL